MRSEGNTAPNDGASDARRADVITAAVTLSGRLDSACVTLALALPTTAHVDPQTMTPRFFALRAGTTDARPSSPPPPDVARAATSRVVRQGP